MSETKEDRTQLSKLPPVADIQADKRARIMHLMEELEVIITQKNALAVLEDEAKDELEKLQMETGKPGFRHGWLVFTAQVVKGRKTLDKMMLLENGCPASILNASYKTGEPYTRSIFKHLTQEDE
jgi:hypothetical protein